ncbi:MAG: DDE-type integrase/transposase/recombinase [Dehalococcoidia bacterium]|nr:DDE-type integrase/transposase/recombinase [Dehalococcoidia bacterium]
MAQFSARIGDSELPVDEDAFLIADGRPGGDLAPAVIAFAAVGISVERVLTDSALNFRRSTAFIATTDELGIAHRRTRAYHPQTNGKAEAFNKTLQ